MDYIYQQLKKQIEIPPMEVDTIFCSSTDNTITKYRSTKQVIHLTKEEVKSIFSTYDIKLPDFLSGFDDGMFERNPEQYIPMQDGYQISEYFGKHNIYIPTFDYFRSIKFGNINAVINIYNGKNSKINIPQIMQKIKVEPANEINNYKNRLPFPEVRGYIKYSSFNNVIYYDKNRINKYMFKFPSLCIDVPYEIYSSQDIPENIFYWDIDKKQMGFTNISNEDILEMFNSIKDNGLQSPLFFQVSQGKLVSASDDDYIRLIICQYLKLPTIPMVLYMMNNHDNSNMLISMRPCDIILSRITDLHPTELEIDRLNALTDPYFVFKDMRSSAFQMNDQPDTPNYSGPIYKCIKPLNEKFNDTYLTNESVQPASDTIINNDNSDEIHEDMKMSIQIQVHDEIEKVINKLTHNI